MILVREGASGDNGDGPHRSATGACVEGAAAVDPLARSNVDPGATAAMAARRSRNAAVAAADDLADAGTPVALA